MLPRVCFAAFSLAAKMVSPGSQDGFVDYRKPAANQEMRE